MAKSKDLEVIKQLEKQIGRKLGQFDLKDIWGFTKGYAIDENGHVIGLNLYEAEISDISILNLKVLNQLTTLDLSGNQISDISPLKELIQVTKLDLNNNQISDISPLKALINVTKLILGSNQISDISPLKELTQVTKLDLNNNQISDISPLKALKQLTGLNLDTNQISDISPLKGLTNLTSLDLDGNQISDISALNLKELKQLRKLGLEHNKISHLPREIVYLNMEIKWEDKYIDEGINLYGNPLESPPVEIVKQGLEAVRSYFKELEEKESVRLLHSKLLIVGNGAVGKTTLMKKLKDNNFIVEVGKEETTHGINIVPWELQCQFDKNDTDKVKIHFWDFGGQDIYHATHQFFLTKRSLYLFVWEPRREEESKSFDYWLNIIKLLSADSPVIAVMNKSDVRTKYIDEASFKEKFDNIVTFLPVSCVNGKGIMELTDQISKTLGGMDHLRDKLPKVWMKIRDHLKAEKKDYIRLSDFFEICRKYGLNEKRAEFLSDYLHDLGVILHYRHDKLLENTVILNPEWATEAVYSLVDTPEIMKNMGRFQFDDLKRYWDLKKFPRDKHAELIRLMEKFELCFPITGTDIHIIPELLPTKRPVIDFDNYKKADNLHFEYHYDFMPEGIITRFISRMYYLIKEDHFWKNGVELRFEDSTALVVSELLNRKMKISVTGSSKSELLGIIRNDFGHIHQTLNMEKNKHYDEMIPCTCSTCIRDSKPYFYNFYSLKMFQQKNKNTITCVNSLEEVPIDILLEGITIPPKNPANMSEEKARQYISNCQYAEGRESLLKAIKEDPDRKNRLKEEFGFIYNLDEGLDEDKKNWRKNEGQIEWRRQIWQIFSARNKFHLKKIEEKSDTDVFDAQTDDIQQTPETEITESPEIIYNGQGKTSEKKGEELEHEMMKLFQYFLHLCEEENELKLIHAKKQPRGPQFGYDLKFFCELKGNIKTKEEKKLKLLIECKSYKDEIKLKDISDKLDEVKAEIIAGKLDIDHWILISPRAKLSSHLDRIIELWEKSGEYPFKVQMWTPETRVYDFFGLIPEIYDKYFKPRHKQIHPKDWDQNKKREVIEFWKKKIEPPFRLPEGWEDYLRNPENLILSGDPKDLASLYHHYVKMKCKDESGTLIKESLDKKIKKWLNTSVDKSPTIFLLGEFGDGKTVFTYILARELAEKFLESPSTGWIPIRFSLKDLGVKGVNNSRDFVERRLKEFGSGISGWNKLKRSNYRLFAILDGFDEISKKLDHKTVLENIESLIECFENELSDMKILITSRRHFFENQKDKQRLIERIGDPQLLQLAPIDRKTTENHLDEYATEINEEEKFKKLKNYHDPIGLASKPLFLEMIKVSLKELPEKDLNELILYKTYTKKALTRKKKLLEDDNLDTSPDKIIENMEEILESVAMELHKADKEFVYLSELKGSVNLKRRLWEMSESDDDTDEDETARIAVRSLLKRGEIESNSSENKWPVDFCHRSMREYFIARAVCNMVQNNIAEAKDFLKNHSLTHEITFFASEIMKDSDFEYADNLINLIQVTKNLKNKDRLKVGYLGCNAVNILYQYRGCLPRNDWAKLILDGADLSYADLSEKNFSGTSLQYANLDNVNFTNANFSQCNLTGVRLEETSPVQSLAVSPSENIYSSYDDGIIREWIYQRKRTPYSINLFTDKKAKELKLIAFPGNDITILNNEQLLFYDKKENKLKQRAVIEKKSNIQLLKTSQDSLLIIEEKEKQNILHLVNLEEQAIVKSINIAPFTMCEHLEDKAFVFYNDFNGLQIIDGTSQKRENIILDKAENVTCLATFHCNNSNEQYRLGVGQSDGTLQIWHINMNDWVANHLFKYKPHDNIIKDIAFIDEERIISGAFDKKLNLLTIDRHGKLKYEPQEFKIRLQCKGMKIEGVTPEKERLLLEKLINKASDEI